MQRAVLNVMAQHLLQCRCDAVTDHGVVAHGALSGTFRGDLCVALS